MCTVSSDELVQFYWTLLSVDIESEEEAVKLLKEVIGLWLTIRGFSIAATLMEQYREANKSVLPNQRVLEKN